MLQEERCSAYQQAQETLGRPLPPPPLGACVIPIVEQYLTLIGSGMHVLDVGCGSWDWIKCHCEKVGAHYEGVDVASEYFGRKVVSTRLENLAELSFGDEQFDVVIGNQTMAHWAEHGCTLRWGLHQCFRVCKPGGLVLLNTPIHFHGTREFMLGQIDVLRELFRPFSLQVTFEKWGSPSLPLPAYYPLPGYWRLRGKPPYVLDIRAVKDRPLPRGYDNRRATSGRTSQLLNYPLSYNVYRLLRKMRVIPKHTLANAQSE